ncbi:sodium:solute symporter family protein [uncultured Paraglaciecola sp.]|uniref:sodium:solute symporter family protein n=1 Tax=uncultured Paraglaciecola sp. TaxID=1765024 RepID=UPI0025931E2C|nr:sodium:solute symporter family protein [uncultured Paraglaciecola sp.]
MNSILILVLVYNIIVICGIGKYLSYKAKQQQQITDMALGGRDAGVAMFSVTIAITYLGSAHVYGLMEMSFAIGAVALWFCFAHTILLCVICLGTGPWIRRVGSATIPELIGKLYGKKLRTYTACVGAMVVFGLVTLETQTLGIGISAMSGWSLGWSAVLGAAIGTAYVCMGGIKQTMWVNLVNAVVMYTAVIIAGIYLAFVLPDGWQGVTQHYVDSGEEFKLSILGTPDLLVGFGLAAIFSVVFSQSVNQQGMQAAMSAKNEQTIKKALWIAAPINGLFGVFPVLVGLAAATIPEFAQLGPKLAGARLIVELLPTWLVVLLQAGFLGALLSTFAMSALAPATIFAKDIIGANVEGGLSPAKEKALIRRTIIVIGVLASPMTFYLQPNVIPAITWLFAWLVPFFFIIVSGLFWKRNTKIATLVLLSCWLVNLFWSFTDIKHHIGLPMLENAHIVALIALIITLVGNLVIRESKNGLFHSEEAKLTP